MNRFKAEGRAGLMDGSSRPKRLYRPTPEEVVRQIERLRRQRRTGQQIAAEVGVSPATVSRVHKRLGLNRIGALEPAEPVRRYEREHPAGELIHMDIKKLGRFNQVGHRITGDRTALVKLKKRNQTGQSLGRRLGVRPCRYCRQLPHRLRQGHAKREETQCYRFLKGRGRLIAQWFSVKRRAQR
jgi:Homeodomain-like domain